MRILLTGGSGFLGKHLVQLLKNNDVDVICIGRHPCPIANVNNIIVPTLNIECIEQALIQNQVKIDALLHLAAAGVNPKDRDDTTLMTINTLLPPQLVHLGKKFGAKAIVMTGSSAEYQDLSLSTPCTETDPLQYRQMYGATKAAGGLCALAQGLSVGIPIAWMRLFNIYGPYEAPHRLFPSLVSSLSAGNPVKMSEGSQIRDFVWVEDACSALWMTLNALLLGQMPSGTYNLCTGLGHSVRNFALTLADLLGVNKDLLQFGALPLRLDDTPYLVGNPLALKNASGWTATYSLKSGMMQAIKDFQSLNTGAHLCL